MSEDKKMKQSTNHASPASQGGQHPTTSNRKDEERRGEQEIAEESLGEGKELKTMEDKPSDASTSAKVLADKKSMEGKYLRALADYQNLLKQTAREKEEFAKFANEQILLAILPVFDNLKTSLAHIDEKVKNGWVDGIRYIIKQFKDVLENSGVEEIKTGDERFDHSAMEAVGREETDDEEKDGLVAREIAAGYKLNGKVIRAARVIVYECKK